MKIHGKFGDNLWEIWGESSGNSWKIAESGTNRRSENRERLGIIRDLMGFPLWDFRFFGILRDLGLYEIRDFLGFGIFMGLALRALG